MKRILFLLLANTLLMGFMSQLGWAYKLTIQSDCKRNNGAVFFNGKDIGWPTPKTLNVSGGVHLLAVKSRCGETIGGLVEVKRDLIVLVKFLSSPYGINVKADLVNPYEINVKDGLVKTGIEKVWCATPNEVWTTQSGNCVGRLGGVGKKFQTRQQAVAEHQRLRNQTSTASSNQAPQETTVQTGSTENIFWQAIKDSDDPNMYREYLRQFPSGVYAGLAKLKIQKLSGSTTSVAQASVPDLDYGRYHALVIGNNRYRHLKPLSTAVNDANAVASLLRSQYQFNVDVLINATRDETVSALSRLRKSISQQDNLLIYYAGHGWLDTEMDEGFWLPVDARDDDQVDWIANDTVMRSVRAMKAKHVMVVADSCFSGTLIRGIMIKERSPDYIREISQKKARTALTSGGVEPVTDVGGGGHSIFAATFIRILSENDGVLDGHQLFTTLRKRVMMGADQTPEYGDIRKAGHDGGDFLFVRR